MTSITMYGITNEDGNFLSGFNDRLGEKLERISEPEFTDFESGADKVLLFTTMRQVRQVRGALELNHGIKTEGVPFYIGD